MPFKNDLKSEFTYNKPGNTIFDHLSSKEFEVVKSVKFEVNYKPGETIRKQGVHLSHVITISSGLAKMYLEGIKNQNLTLRIIKPGTFIGGPGMYFDQRHHYTIKALTNTTASFIEVQVFKNLIDSNKAFADDFMRDFSRNLLLTYDRLISLTQKPVRSKIADALLYLSGEIFNSPIIDSIITNHDLAELTNSSKDSITKTIRNFGEKGIICYENNNLKILKPELLSELSETV